MVGVPSGMEMMIKAAGLGDVVKMAQRLSDEKSVERIIAVVNQLEENQRTLNDVKQMMIELRGLRNGSTIVPCPGCPLRDSGRGDASRLLEDHRAS